MNILKITKARKEYELHMMRREQTNRELLLSAINMALFLLIPRFFETLQVFINLAIASVIQILALFKILLLWTLKTLLKFLLFILIETFFIFVIAIESVTLILALFKILLLWTLQALVQFLLYILIEIFFIFVIAINFLLTIWNIVKKRSIKIAVSVCSKLLIFLKSVHRSIAKCYFVVKQKSNLLCITIQTEIASMYMHLMLNLKTVKENPIAFVESIADFLVRYKREENDVEDVCIFTFDLPVVEISQPSIATIELKEDLDENTSIVHDSMEIQTDSIPEVAESYAEIELKEDLDENTLSIEDSLKILHRTGSIPELTESIAKIEVNEDLDDSLKFLHQPKKARHEEEIDSKECESQISESMVDMKSNDKSNVESANVEALSNDQPFSVLESIGKGSFCKCFKVCKAGKIFAAKVFYKVAYFSQKELYDKVRFLNFAYVY
jgi:signal transduction histidine kinase